MVTGNTQIFAKRFLHLHFEMDIEISPEFNFERSRLKTCFSFEKSLLFFSTKDLRK
jgi:hypothetical protein